MPKDSYDEFTGHSCSPYPETAEQHSFNFTSSGASSSKESVGNSDGGRMFTFRNFVTSG